MATEDGAPVAPTETPAPDVEADAQAQSADVPLDERAEAVEAFRRALAGDDAPAPKGAPAAKTDGEQPDEADAQAATDAAKPAEVKPEDAKDAEAQKFAARFEALKAEERRVRAEKETWKAERAEFEEYRRAKAEAKANPLKALQALGLDVTSVNEAFLSGGKPDPLSEMKAQLDALRAEQQQAKQAAEVARQEAAVNGFKAQISQALKAKADTYELAALRDSEAVELAYQAVDAYVSQYGELPGGTTAAAIEQALAHVEGAMEAEAVRYMTAKKVQAKLAPQRAAPSTEAPRPPVSQAAKQQSKTLTNSQAAVAPPRRQDADTNLSDEERRAQAVRLFAQAFADS